MRTKIGRHKGSRNKGYFYRTGRGWFAKESGQFIPLLDEAGTRLRDENVEERVVREAFARQTLAKPVPPVLESADDAVEVGLVCGKYLEHLRTQVGDALLQNPKGLAKTYIDRGQTLFDFCYGLPGEFFCAGDKEKRETKKDAEKKRLHAGFGVKLCCDLTPQDIDAWLKAHAWSPGGWRTRVQAVKRAFNFGVERKLISVSPIKGYKLPKSTSRVTYLTPVQEQAMIAASNPAFAIALKVCIRTGARFGCEFAALTARHVRDHGDRMEWVFKPEESKTKRQRIVRIIDPEVIALVRERIRDRRGSTLFGNRSGNEWSRKMLSQNFRRVKARVEKNGMQFDKDACMYSCRHTYAKRILEGYWTAKPASIKTLARLMGNTVHVCIEHYLQFSEADNEMLWGAA